MKYYFVVYFQGEDENQHSCEDFFTLHGAESFIKVWVNKGYTCHLFEGVYVRTNTKVH